MMSKGREQACLHLKGKHLKKVFFSSLILRDINCGRHEQKQCASNP